MRFAAEIGGVKFWLDPAAISAVRYRAEYGRSVVTDLLEADTAEKLESCLIRLTHAMIPPSEGVDVLDFARRCRKDRLFLVKGLAARDALLAPGAQVRGKPVNTSEPFDEYHIIALLALAGLDIVLLYELPILHIFEVATRCFEGRGEGKSYRKLDAAEMQSLYPR